MPAPAGAPHGSGLFCVYKLHFVGFFRVAVDLFGVVVRGNSLLHCLLDNIGAKLSLSDIADKFNYSRSFLCKTFKEQTGESIMSYFNRLKIAEAERLLRETDKTISAVSASLGFADAKYFGALFKSHTGSSPTEFREKINNF